MQTIPGETLLTRSQAAELLNLKPQTLACWASTRRGGPPYAKIGGVTRYRREDVLAYIAANTVRIEPVTRP